MTGLIRCRRTIPQINRQSRRAIERLGATPGGILRARMIMANGTSRPTVVYSIIAGMAHSPRNPDWQLEKPRS